MNSDQRQIAAQVARPAPAIGGQSARTKHDNPSASDQPRTSNAVIAGRLGASAIVLAAALTLVGNRDSAVHVGAVWVLIALGTGLIGFRIGSGKNRAKAFALPGSPVSDAQRTLLLATIPLWGGQLQAARREGDQSIEALARSFEEIVAGLEKALNESHHAISEMQTSGNVTAQIKTASVDLDGVLKSIASLHEAKWSVLAEIIRSGRELREINDEVKQLALQSRMLSLNAAIEAARAGEAGRPFAVVVTEMRNLSARTSEASRRISSQLGQIDTAVQSMRQEDEQTTDSEVSSINQAEVAIASVLQRFATLTESLSASVAIMDVNGEQVREKIADALVALQFQDRVSQIIGHTAADLDKLRKHLEAGTLDAHLIASWQADMAKNFSTDEEFASVDGNRRKRASNDVTFF